MRESNISIVCFGEVLWDVYQDQSKKLGGAPLNVAAHLHQLGTSSHIISMVGNDENGLEVKKEIEHYGLSSKYIGIDESPTGIVQVLLDNNGKPSYEILNPSAWDHILLMEESIDIVKNANALLFGSLACRSDISYHTLLSLIKAANTKIFDLNLRQQFYSKELIDTLLHHTDILKINDEEAALLCALFGIEMKDFYEHITKVYNINMIILTRGADGAEIYVEGKLYEQEGFEVEVVDTVGSGDAFLASFLHHQFSGHSYEECLYQACWLGALVATKIGAVPILDKNKILI